MTEACERFMRRVGEKCPWLHPDFDPASPLWRLREQRAEAAMRQKRGKQ